VIRTIAEGLMGIEPDASQRMVKTVSHLTAETRWAKLENVPVFDNQIAVSHTGLGASSLSNQSGPAIRWRAAFQGAFQTLEVDGKARPAEFERDAAGNAESFVIVRVAPKQTVIVKSRALATER
jgi:hypothetical protein